MASTNSDYLENQVIEGLIRNATKYLAIFTSNPSFETGAGGTEATGGGYVRKACAFDVPSEGATANSAQIEWTLGTDIGAGTYTGWALYDNTTGGNMLFGDTFSASRTLATTGDKLRFSAGAITYSNT